ncbi:hypothetical protein AR158_c721R [Paramecium bursaria Chlorella virus AR158]|uniref:hypothetical protein n=1 Tax=Paramecium bursaria Chlorella virus AR158 TaxID=380598 RepID=UPI00015AA889|nr:hypothetical protein AR158_c721R [Paramecium bursaria Chlorella virus AR158]ABU44266.1 hypothetical protein AR158_c721R [Paramecium bursaria Chlorella virus AR158]
MSAIRMIKCRSSSCRARSNVPVFSNGHPALFNECSRDGTTFLKFLFKVHGYPIAIFFAWRCTKTFDRDVEILAKIII